MLNGSINAHIGMPNTTAYAASKAARLRLPAEQVSEVASNSQAQIPLKRVGTPEEIASAVLYLAVPAVPLEVVADRQCSGQKNIMLVIILQSFPANRPRVRGMKPLDRPSLTARGLHG